LAFSDRHLLPNTFFCARKRRDGTDYRLDICPFSRASAASRETGELAGQLQPITSPGNQTEQGLVASGKPRV
jgi:hypothetical protein